MMDAIVDPPQEEHQTMLDWHGGPFDPIGFKNARARLGMGNMARRRRGPLASHRGGVPASEAMSPTPTRIGPKRGRALPG